MLWTKVASALEGFNNKNATDIEAIVYYIYQREQYKWYMIYAYYTANYSRPSGLETAEKINNPSMTHTHICECIE